jgi:hypothetical protein
MSWSNGGDEALLGGGYDVTLKVSWVRVIPARGFLIYWAHMADFPYSGRSHCERCFLNGSDHAMEEGMLSDGCAPILFNFKLL